jgi:hypothetical protein
MRFIFGTQLVSRAFYEFSSISLRYLSSGHYENEKFFKKNTLHEILRFLSFIYLSSGFVSYLNDKYIYFCFRTGKKTSITTKKNTLKNYVYRHLKLRLFLKNE